MSEAPEDGVLQAQTERARQIARRIVESSRGKRLRPEDADDVVASVLLRLLRTLRDRPLAITNFDGFVATLTYNTLSDFFRARFPERTRLKNRLRYVLTHDRRLATWSADDGIAAGLAKWRGSYQLLRRAGLSRDHATPRMLDRDATGDALVEILTFLGAPLLIDDLVAVTAELWGVTEQETVEVTAAADDAPSVERRLEKRQALDRVWREILDLRAPQRTALLLNLRDSDGMNALALFLLAGSATIDDIAESLDMTSHALAAIWNELPMDDLRIGAMLGASRQQVINLRKSARDRLARRTNK